MQTDLLYLGNFSSGSGPVPTSGTIDSPAQGITNPVYNIGVGPAGRIFCHNIVPLTVGTANVAALQAPSSGIPLVLTAGTGVTLGLAPDGSQQNVLVFDTPRGASLTSAGGQNLSGVNFTWVGYDMFGRKTTQTLAGPNGSTVTTKKTFMSVLSCTPSASNAAQLTAGTSDLYGMPWLVFDKTYVLNLNWANSYTTDTGTFTLGDATTPATASTGDPRGTYLTSSASNGTNRLIVAVHLDATQCGPQAVAANVLGVTPA